MASMFQLIIFQTLLLLSHSQSNITANPSSQPSLEPTPEPTLEPSLEPTLEPTVEPSISTEPTLEPVFNLNFDPTMEPTLEPTNYPSSSPTHAPSSLSATNYATTMSPNITFPFSSSDTDTTNVPLTTDSRATTQDLHSSTNTLVLYETERIDSKADSGVIDEVMNAIRDNFLMVILIGSGIVLLCCCGCVTYCYCCKGENRNTRLTIGQMDIDDQDIELYNLQNIHNAQYLTVSKEDHSTTANKRKPSRELFNKFMTRISRTKSGFKPSSINIRDESEEELDHDTPDYDL